MNGARQRWPQIAALHLWKKLQAQGSLLAKLESLRSSAVQWITNEKDAELWEGVLIRDFIEATMSTDLGSLAHYLQYMGEPNTWIDAVMMHALACLFKVDVVIFQIGSDTSFVGTSLAEASASTPPLVPVAMANDRHWWGLSYTSPHEESIFAGDRTDPLYHHLRKDHSDESGDQGDADDHVADFCFATTPPNPPQNVEIELNVCLALRSWDAFAEPNADVLASLEALSKTVTPDPAMACAVRSRALEDIAFEDEHYASIPEGLRYRGPRRRLSNRQLNIDASDKHFFALSHLKTTTLLQHSKIVQDL